MKEDMRGLFFIVKGQYCRNKGHKFLNEASGDYNHTGGYDPEDPETPKWYMLVERETYTTLNCGSDLNKVLAGVYRYITRYKTKDKYLKMLRSLEYSGAPSPIHKRLQQEIDKDFSWYFEDLVAEQEDKAYADVHDEMVNPLYKKTKKRLTKTITPKTPEVTLDAPLFEETPPAPPAKKVAPKKLKGLKKKLAVEM